MYEVLLLLIQWILWDISCCLLITILKLHKCFYTLKLRCTIFFNAKIIFEVMGVLSLSLLKVTCLVVIEKNLMFHTPFQNGVIERKNKHIMEKCLALLMHVGVPMIYRKFALKTTVHLTNRMPHKTLNNCSPYKLLFHFKPTYSYFEIFGCLYLQFLRPYNHNKLDLCLLTCVFLVYVPQYKRYWCLEPASKKIYISTYVRFNKRNFIFFDLLLFSNPHLTQLFLNLLLSLFPLVPLLEKCAIIFPIYLM